jgi:hypothetical protein
MYMSLNRIDVELRAEGDRRRLVQTDHRLASEIAERPGLSTVAALVRCLNARRDDALMDVVYYCQHEPPRFLRDAVGVAAARLVVGESSRDLPADAVPIVPEPDRVSELFDQGMRELALEVMRDLGVEQAMVGLRRVERKLLELGFPDEEADETAFWISVLELAALVSVASFETNAGAWHFDPVAPGSLPFIYRCRYRGDEASANPLGKALKFLRGKGDGEEPSALVAVLASSP